MRLLKTVLIMGGTAVLLFVAYVVFTVVTTETTTNSKTFGLGLFLVPLLSVWLWAAVLAVCGLYYRLSRKAEVTVK